MGRACTTSIRRASSCTRTSCAARLARSLGKATLNAQYRDPQRRFLFGTVSWQKDLPGYTYEFWEGDKLTAALLRQTDEVVRASFRDPIRFKTNSTQHEQLASGMKLPFVSRGLVA